MIIQVGFVGDKVALGKIFFSCTSVFPADHDSSSRPTLLPHLEMFDRSDRPGRHKKFSPYLGIHSCPCMRHEVLMTVKMLTLVLWTVTLCGLVGYSDLKMKAVCSAETLVFAYKSTSRP
jgi:hypothetical protein